MKMNAKASKHSNSNGPNTKDQVSDFIHYKFDPSVPPDEYVFDRERLDLLQQEPFMGGISLRLPMRADWNVPTAYVSCDRQGNIILGYNPGWMRSLTYEQRKGVFKHEVLHIALMHVAGRAVADPRKARLWNVATDLAINSIISNGGSNMAPIADCLLLPGREPKTKDQGLKALIKSFPHLESSDFYMDALEQYAESQGNPEDGDGNITIDIGGDGQFDGHGGWGNIPEELRDILRENVRELVSQGVKNAHRAGQWGSIPSSTSAQIEALLKHELDWKAILRMFLGRARSQDRNSTIKRINKRAPYMMPGVKRSTVANFLWAIDQSGSVSDENVQRGLAEAFACSKEGKIDIVNFDTEIDMSSFKTVQNGQGFKWERTRCGGTDFNAVSEFLNRQENRGKYSAVVIFTDGYAPTMNSIVGTKVLWLITEDGTMEAPRPGDLAVKMDKPKSVKRV